MTNHRPFEYSEMQHRVLGWVEHNEGAVAIFPQTLSRPTLRALMDRQLVVISISRPPKYRLTVLGRAMLALWTQRHGHWCVSSPPLAAEAEAEE